MASKSTSIKSHLPRAYADLLASIGFFIEHWGFKEVHGQVWTCIFLAEHAVDARHIIQHLQVSKAAVSLAIKDLLDYNVIQEVQKTKPSTRKYVSNPDLCEVILNVLRARERKILNTVVDAANSFLESGKEELSRIHVSRDKLRQLKDLAQSAQDTLDQVIRTRDGDLTAMFHLLEVENRA